MGIILEIFKFRSALLLCELFEADYTCCAQAILLSKNVVNIFMEIPNSKALFFLRQILYMVVNLPCLFVKRMPIQVLGVIFFWRATCRFLLEIHGFGMRSLVTYSLGLERSNGDLGKYNGIQTRSNGVLLSFPNLR